MNLKSLKYFRETLHDMQKKKNNLILFISCRSSKIKLYLIYLRCKGKQVIWKFREFIFLVAESNV